MVTSISSSIPPIYQMPLTENLTIVKLGGSVITNKSSKPPEVNRSNLIRIAKELRDYEGHLIIVLGGGAHGHQAANAHGYGDSSTPIDQLIRGIPHIRHNMSTLALEVETTLSDAGILGVVISPFSTTLLRNGSIIKFPLDLIEKTLDSKLVVITHGDVCYDEVLGASILSGDTITVHLADELSAAALYLGTDVDGVFEDDPRKNPNAKLIQVIDKLNMKEVLEKSGPSSATDVTGGMSRKLKELFKISSSGTEIAIFNLTKPNRLSDLLSGKPTYCTRISM